MKPFTITGTVNVFPGMTGWHYVAVPERYTKLLPPIKWGLYPARFSCGSTSWRSSLLPFGKKATGPAGCTHFVALPAKVRKAENITSGSRVRVTVTL